MRVYYEVVQCTRVSGYVVVIKLKCVLYPDTAVIIIYSEICRRTAEYVTKAASIPLGIPTRLSGYTITVYALQQLLRNLRYHSSSWWGRRGLGAEHVLLERADP